MADEKPKAERKPRAKREHAEPHDDPTPVDEGAPKLETPEDPAPAPVVALEEDKEDDASSDDESQEAVATEIAEVDLHVASNPVDAHAPVWTGREPNSA